jgi:hypothetical protein
VRLPDSGRLEFRPVCHDQQHVKDMTGDAINIGVSATIKLQGSNPASNPAKPLVSVRINRQLSGWNLPTLMVDAFEAHCQSATLRSVLATASAL